MSNNQQLLSEAIAAIPLWRAFLDEKEAEQDALLAQMHGKESKPKQILRGLTQRLNKAIQPAGNRVGEGQETENENYVFLEVLEEAASDAKPLENEKPLQASKDNSEKPEFASLFN